MARGHVAVRVEPQRHSMNASSPALIRPSQSSDCTIASTAALPAGAGATVTPFSEGGVS